MLRTWRDVRSREGKMGLFRGFIPNLISKAGVRALQLLIMEDITKSIYINPSARKVSIDPSTNEYVSNSLQGTCFWRRNGISESWRGDGNCQVSTLLEVTRYLIRMQQIGHYLRHHLRSPKCSYKLESLGFRLECSKASRSLYSRTFAL